MITKPHCEKCFSENLAVMRPRKMALRLHLPVPKFALRCKDCKRIQEAKGLTEEDLQKWGLEDNVGS